MMRALFQVSPEPGLMMVFWKKIMEDHQYV
jgi:hypothetical protein